MENNNKLKDLDKHITHAIKHGNDERINREMLLKIVDNCFHAYASDFRNDAREMADELFDEYIKNNT